MCFHFTNNYGSIFKWWFFHRLKYMQNFKCCNWAMFQNWDFYILMKMSMFFLYKKITGFSPCSIYYHRIGWGVKIQGGTLQRHLWEVVWWIISCFTCQGFPPVWYTCLFTFLTVWSFISLKIIELKESVYQNYTIALHRSSQFVNVRSTIINLYKRCQMLCA